MSIVFYLLLKQICLKRSNTKNENLIFVQIIHNDFKSRSETK